MAVTKYTVRTFVDGIEVQSQPVDSMEELQDNAFVIFDRSKELKASAGIDFTGGTVGEENADAHQKARNAFESYAFNILLCATDDETEQDAYIDYTKQMRDEYGVRFQTVIPYVERKKKINHEGIIQVGNTVTDAEVPYAHVYWVAGAEAGCRVQDSVMAKVYSGNYTISANVTRAEMEQAIDNGILLFHNVNRTPVVLKDINSLVQITPENREKKNDDFKSNQTVRVIDTVAIESAEVFNGMFLGKVPNDDTGRTLLRNELIKIRTELVQKRAVGPYDEADLAIQAGKGLGDVVGFDAVQPRNCMEKLFLYISFLQV